MHGGGACASTPCRYLEVVQHELGGRVDVGLAPLEQLADLARVLLEEVVRVLPLGDAVRALDVLLAHAAEQRLDVLLRVAQLLDAHCHADWFIATQHEVTVKDEPFGTAAGRGESAEGLGTSTAQLTLTTPRKLTARKPALPILGLGIDMLVEVELVEERAHEDDSGRWERVPRLQRWPRHERNDVHLVPDLQLLAEDVNHTAVQHVRAAM